MWDNIGSVSKKEPVEKLTKVRMSRRAKAALKAVAAHLDMRELGVMSRLVEWFGRQPDDVRLGCLGFHPSMSEEEIAQTIREQNKRQ